MFNEINFDTGELILNVAKGSAVGSPIVFLHGLSGRWQEYQLLLMPLAQEGHVYAPDLRGHGKSGRGARYLLADYGRDNLFLLRQEVREPAVLIGHSWGGLTALVVAASAPELVKKLILLDPPLCSREVGLSARPEIWGWLNWIHEMATAKRPLSEIVISCQQMAPELDEATAYFLSQSVVSLDPAAIAVALNDQTLDGVDLAATLTRITCPTLLLYGDWQHGATVRDEDAVFLQTHLLHADVVKVTKAGHMLHQEQPELVWQQIAQFLALAREIAH